MGMKVLFDTSVLVSACVAEHPKHTAALSLLQKAISREIEFVVAAHSLLECYAVLTTLPLAPKISPHVARELIYHNIEKHADIVALTSKEYSSVIDSIAKHGFLGGVVYDALIFKVAEKAEVDQLLTLNEKDFKRLDLLNNIAIISSL